MDKETLILIGVAVMGGFVNYLGTIRDEKHRFKIIDLIAELCTSGFTGFLVALAAAEAGMGWNMTAVAVGMAGHAGGRGLFILRRIVFNVLDESRGKKS